jgi:hypothetical protein
LLDYAFAKLRLRFEAGFTLVVLISRRFQPQQFESVPGYPEEAEPANDML